MNDIIVDLPCVSAAPIQNGRPPFVGGRPFTQEDEPYFFGRSREAMRLTNTIAANTVTVLYGSSGVGKSSLLSARLPQELHRITKRWIIVAFNAWRADFKEALKQEITSQLGSASRDALEEAEDFGHLGDGLFGVARRQGKPIVLIFDQFEEYFLYHPSGHEWFEHGLELLANTENGPVRILLALRRDRLFLLDRLRKKIPEIYRSLVSLDPLDADATRDAILKPIDVYNAELGAERRVERPDDRLVCALIEGADENRIRYSLVQTTHTTLNTGQPNAGSVRVVGWFLQIALDALWRHDIIGELPASRSLKVASLRKLAGLSATQADSEAVGMLVHQHVANVLDRFSRKERKLLACMLGAMITRSGTKIAVNPEADFADLLNNRDKLAARPLLVRLSSAPPNERLVREVTLNAGSEEEDDTHFSVHAEEMPHSAFEVTHDALATPLRAWISRREEETRFSTILTRATLTLLGLLVVGTMFSVVSTCLSQRNLVQRAEHIGAEQSDMNYRRRVLSLLAARMNVMDVLKSIGWIDTENLDHLIAVTLKRAPSWSGRAASVAINADSSQAALLILPSINVGAQAGVETSIVTLDSSVKALPICSGNTKIAALPQTPDNAPNVATNQAAAIIRTGDCETVAFVDGVSLNYIDQLGTWASSPLTAVLPNYNSPIQSTGVTYSTYFDTNPGSIQIRRFFQDRNIRVARLNGTDKPTTFVGTDFGSAVHLSNFGFPIISPAGDYEAHFIKQPPAPLPGQLVAPLLVVTSLKDGNKQGDILAETPFSAGQYDRPYSRSLAAVFVTSGTTQYVVFITKNVIGVVEVSQDLKLKLIQSFSLPHGSSLSSQVMSPQASFTAALIQQRWRFAWLTDRGPVVYEAMNDNRLRSVTSGGLPLLGGLIDGTKLILSASGRTLIQIRTFPPDLDQVIRAWNFDTSDSSVDPRSQGCALARQENDSNQLTPEEMLSDLGQIVPQPCPLEKLSAGGKRPETALTRSGEAVISQPSTKQPQR